MEPKDERQPNPPIDNNDDDDEWEYEYSTTETEVWRGRFQELCYLEH